MRASAPGLSAPTVRIGTVAVAICAAASLLWVGRDLGTPARWASLAVARLAGPRSYTLASALLLASLAVAVYVALRRATSRAPSCRIALVAAIPSFVTSLVYGILVVDRPESHGGVQLFVLVPTRFAFWPLIVLGLVLLVFGISNVVRLHGNPAGRFVGLIYVVTAAVGIFLVWQGIAVRTA